MPTNKQLNFLAVAQDQANSNKFFALKFVFNATTSTFDVFVEDLSNSGVPANASQITSTGTALSGGGGTGMAIGNLVAGATPDRLLYVGPTGLLANSAAMTFNGVDIVFDPTASLTLGDSGTGINIDVAANQISIVSTNPLFFTDNVRQTFNPGATVAGLNVGSLAGDPSTPVNGDLWYDSTNNLLRARINGATASLSTAGGSNTQLQYNNAGAFGGISGLTTDGTNVTAGSGNLRATSPRITTGLQDANGNEIISFTAVGSAVNEITISNNTTGNNPIISATGDDANISLTLTPKGTGVITLSSGSLRLPSGSAAAPSLSLTAQTGSGIYFNSSFGGLGIASNGVSVLSSDGNNLFAEKRILLGTSVLGYGATVSSIDTGLSRVAAGVVGVGNGTAASVAGTLRLTALQDSAGAQVVTTRQAAVADAAGGATIDTEARAAINALLARLRTHGLIAT